MPPIKQPKSNLVKGTKEPDLPKPLKGYRSLGLDFGCPVNGQAMATCPYCNKEGHFSIKAENGVFNCLRCGEQGNLLLFLRHRYEEVVHDKLDADNKRLRRDRGISLFTQKTYGVVFDNDERYWLLPFKNAEGEIVNVQRYLEKNGNFAGGKWNISTLPLYLFGLEHLSDDKDKPVLIFEGALDMYVADSHLRENKRRARYDLLAVPGANTFKEAWCKRLEGRKVILCYDNDDAGRNGYNTVIQAFRDTGVNVDLKVLEWPADWKFPDKYDIGDLLQNYEVTLPSFVQEYSVKRELRVKTRFNFIRADKVVREEKRWLWQDRIPQGSLVSLTGAGSDGKSTLVRYVAACYSAGIPLYGCKTALAAGKVIYFTSEDSPSDVADILEVHGADLTRIEIHSMIDSDGEMVDIIKSLPDLEEQIKCQGVSLVIFDGLNSFLTDDDMKTDIKSRRKIGPLHNLAQRLGITVIGLRHWDKGGAGKDATRRELGPSCISHLGRANMHTFVQKTEEGVVKRRTLYFGKVSDASEEKHPPLDYVLWNRGGNLRTIRWFGPAERLKVRKQLLELVQKRRERREQNKVPEKGAKIAK